jgi:hypothetical protein
MNLTFGQKSLLAVLQKKGIQVENAEESQLSH